MPPCDPPSSPSPPSQPPPPSANWYWSDDRGNCNDACAAYGLACDAEQVKPLLPAQDPTYPGVTPEEARDEWLRIAGVANVVTPSIAMNVDVCATEVYPQTRWSESSSTLTSVPSFRPSTVTVLGCAAALNDNGAYAFACGIAPGQPERRRLCYCTPPPPSTPPPGRPPRPPPSPPPPSPPP